MKENVFSREEPDGTVTVYSTLTDITGNAPTQREAVNVFARKLREQYPFSKITVEPAEGD